MAAINPDFFHPGSPVRSHGQTHLNGTPININGLLDTVLEQIVQEVVEVNPITHSQIDLNSEGETFIPLSNVE